MKKLLNLLKESQQLDYHRLNIGEEYLDDTSMTPDEKRAFVEAVASYRKIGEAIYHNGNLMEAYENIKNIVESAEKLTLKETGDWFDKVTVNRHMKSMNEAFKIFSSTIKEVATLQQRLESSYDEIGEVLGKYYEIKEGNEFGAERAKAIASGDDTFNVGGKSFKVTDVDAEDKKNAEEFTNESMKLSSFLKNKRSLNEANDKLMKVGATMMVGGDGSGMVKPVKMKLVSINYLPKEDKYSYKFQGGGRTQYYTDDVLAKKLKESVNEAKVIVYNEKTGERYEVLSGKGKGDLIIAMKALQSAAPSHMKYSIKENQSVNETKFYAFWGNKKHEIEANDLFDAKQKAITMLKVPKSKVGLLAVVNAKAHDGGSFVYELDGGLSAELPKASIPAAIQQRLALAIEKIESGKLNFNQKIQLLGQVVDALNIDRTQLGTLTTKIKSKMEEELSAELPKATIPAAIQQRLALAIEKIESGKLNFNQKIQLLGQVVDALNIDRTQLGTLTTKIKSKMESYQTPEEEVSEGNEFGAERARAIAMGNDTFTVDGKTYKVTDVDPADKENAEEFTNESMRLTNLLKKKLLSEATARLSDQLKQVVNGSTSRVGSIKVDKKTAEKLLKLYNLGDVKMQNKFDGMDVDKVISAFKPFMENKNLTEVAPEGWEGTVKAMKDEPGIDNPYALAWWMKGRGYKSHKE